MTGYLLLVEDIYGLVAYECDTLVQALRRRKYALTKPKILSAIIEER